MKTRPSISPTDLKEIVQKACDEQGIELPESFNDDFQEVFGGIGTVKTIEGIRKIICKALKAATPEKSDMKKTYEGIIIAIKDDVRTECALQLGIKEILEKPRVGGKPSFKETLIEFLESLEEGESWSSYDLESWGDGKGKRLYQNFHLIMPWNDKTIRILLGDDAEEKLKNNPFVQQRELKIKSLLDARKYLIEFLDSLPAKKGWNYNDLKNWEGSVKGKTLASRIADYGKGSFCEAAIRKVLGKEAEEYLRRNPFIGYKPKRNIRSSEKTTGCSTKRQATTNQKHRVDKFFDEFVFQDSLTVLFPEETQRTSKIFAILEIIAEFSRIGRPITGKKIEDKLKKKGLSTVDIYRLIFSLRNKLNASEKHGIELYKVEAGYYLQTLTKEELLRKNFSNLKSQTEEKINTAKSAIEDQKRLFLKYMTIDTHNPQEYKIFEDIQRMTTLKSKCREILTQANTELTRLKEHPAAVREEVKLLEQNLEAIEEENSRLEKNPNILKSLKNKQNKTRELFQECLDGYFQSQQSVADLKEKLETCDDEDEFIALTKKYELLKKQVKELFEGKIAKIKQKFRWDPFLRDALKWDSWKDEIEKELAEIEILSEIKKLMSQAKKRINNAKAITEEQKLLLSKYEHIGLHNLQNYQVIEDLERRRTLKKKSQRRCKQTKEALSKLQEHTKSLMGTEHEIAVVKAIQLLEQELKAVEEKKRELEKNPNILNSLDYKELRTRQLFYECMDGLSQIQQKIADLKEKLEACEDEAELISLTETYAILKKQVKELFEGKIAKIKQKFRWDPFLRDTLKWDSWKDEIEKELAEIEMLMSPTGRIMSKIKKLMSQARTIINAARSVTEEQKLLLSKYKTLDINNLQRYQVLEDFERMTALESEYKTIYEQAIEDLEALDEYTEELVTDDVVAVNDEIEILEQNLEAIEEENSKLEKNPNILKSLKYELPVIPGLFQECIEYILQAQQNIDNLKEKIKACESESESKSLTESCQNLKENVSAFFKEEFRKFKKQLNVSQILISLLQHNRWRNEMYAKFFEIELRIEELKMAFERERRPTISSISTNPSEANPVQIKTERPASTDKPDWHKFVEDCLGKTHNYAYRRMQTLPPHADENEIIAAAEDGLMKAAKNYEPERGDFWPYAKRKIEGSILDKLRNIDPLPRSSRRIVKGIANGDIAAEDISPNIMAQIYFSSYSLDQQETDAGPEQETDARPNHEKIGEKDPEYERALTRISINAIIKKLPPLEKAVILAYYVNDMKLKDIGSRLGVTESRASQIITEALARLRRRNDTDPFSFQSP